jgi:CheY-like chemotaxis protein
MTNHNTELQRRRDPRIRPKGTVILRIGTYIMRGRISNLSLGGVATATRTTAPERFLGNMAEVDLRLDGQRASWLRLQGHVVRIQARSIALRLDGAPPSFARVLDQAVTASHNNDQRLSVLLVDSLPVRRSAMSEAFRAAGCIVLDVSTPLEAIVRLGESDFEPNLVAVADSMPLAISDELRRFVEAEHPRARLVTIGDAIHAIDAPTGLGQWLSAANPADDLAARIRTVLTTLDRR